MICPVVSVASCVVSCIRIAAGTPDIVLRKIKVTYPAKTPAHVIGTSFRGFWVGLALVVAHHHDLHFVLSVKK